jgi:hypothetical protein
MNGRFIIPGVAFLLTVWTVDAWTQCAMCVTALQNSAEGRMIANSFGNGILFLLAMPYIIFGTIAFTIYRAYNKKSQKRGKGVL